jgi:hypothetical protein
LYGGSSSIVDTADGASPGCRGMPNFCLKGDLTTPIGRITMCFMDTSVLPPAHAVAAVQVSSSPSACAADVDGGTDSDDESGGDACRDCSSSMVDARAPPPGSAMGRCPHSEYSRPPCPDLKTSSFALLMQDWAHSWTARGCVLTVDGLTATPSRRMITCHRADTLPRRTLSAPSGKNCREELNSWQSGGQIVEQQLKQPTKPCWRMVLVHSSGFPLAGTPSWCNQHL